MTTSSLMGGDGGQALWIVLLLLSLLWSMAEGAGAAAGSLGFRYVDVLNNKSWRTDAQAMNHYSSSQFDNSDKIVTNHKEIDNGDDANNNNNNNKAIKDEYADVQELFLEQRLDHFAPSQGRSFHQRYFYTDRFVVQHPANTTSSRQQQQQQQQQQQYAFLCVGGEGPALDESVLVDSVHCTGDMIELAAILHTQHGASVHLFALEHRYYGRSYPKFFDSKNQSVSPVTNGNLVYLSSRQALADLAHFVESMTETSSTTTKITTTTTTTTTTTMSKTRHLRTSATSSIAKTTTTKRMVPADCKWVSFGGSYPGMLAGWARLKYPHLIHAAVSNSAPVQAQVDMASYNDRLAFDLQFPRIGGTEECLEIFQTGHAQLVDALEKGDTDMRNQIAEQFQLCNGDDLQYRENVQIFLGDGVVHVDAQSNDPSCMETMCNIERLCSFAEQRKRDNATKASWEILAEMAREQEHGECLDIDFNKTLSFFASPRKGILGGMRSWLWQTCTEFGFYQTCEVASNCPFGRGYHPLGEDFEICSIAFGINSKEVRDSVEQTMENYGGKELKGGSRILSVNGNVDPWATLARTSDTTNNQWLPVYVVDGASHHFWTHKVKPTDDANVKEARSFIYETVMNWLKLESDSKLRVGTSSKLSAF